MQKTQTWRGLLGELIKNPYQRQRIADTLNVTHVTINRWVQHESKPRPQTLRRLLLIFPEHRQSFLELIEKEFPGFTLAHVDEEQPDKPFSIPSAFYKRVIHTLTALPRTLRFPAISDLILQQALEQLDPQKQGMAIIVACCMPPAAGKIRSLHERAGRGTPPWKYDLEQQGILLGAESLAGYVLSAGHLDVNQSLTVPFNRGAGYGAQWEESAVAAPILHLGKVAGSLLASSTQPGYFSTALCALIESYAELFVLAFDPEEFYELPQVELALLPPREEQLPYFAGFAQRVAQVMAKTRNNGHATNIVEAQQIVWQHIEQKLLFGNANENGHH